MDINNGMDVIDTRDIEERIIELDDELEDIEYEIDELNQEMNDLKRDDEDRENEILKEL